PPTLPRQRRDPCGATSAPTWSETPRMAQTPRTRRAGRSASSSPSSTCATTEPGVPERPALTPSALRAWVQAEGLPSFRVEQILRWSDRGGSAEVAARTDVAGRRRRALADPFALPLLRPREVARAADNTRKLLFGLEQGRAVEAVIIPDPPRLTVCISSQA